MTINLTPSQSGIFNSRVLVNFIFCSVRVLLVLLVALLPGNARGSVADSRPDRTFVTNGPVQAIVRSGDTIYIGGRFDRVGPRTGPGVEVALDGSQNPGLPEISGAGPSATVGSGGGLSAVAADGSGGWYVGGLFTHVGGVPRTNLAHIRADHSVDPSFNPSVNDAVHTLAVSASTVYVAGLFTSIGGQTRNYIAALNAADGSVKAFNPNANAGIEALAISSDGSIVYAGGRFTMIGGQPRISIAALNVGGPLDGTATLTFNPSATGSVGTGVVNALAISGSTLYVGGSFNTIGGQPRNNIAALSLGLPLDGVAVPGFNPSSSYHGCAACGTIQALAASGSTVYAGGLFDTIGGQPRNFLAGLNPVDGTATPFNPSPNSNIFTLAISSDGSIVYTAGGFNSSNGSPSIGGQARNYAAAVNALDGTATGFNPNPNAIVTAFGVSGSAVYLGGYFSSLGGVVRHSIAAISATDGSATNFDPNANGFNGGSAIVYALAVSGSTVYVGGYFGSIGGQARASIAAVNAADGSATSWDPSGHYFTGPAVVEALAVDGATIYAGGVFTSIGGQTRSNIAAISAAGGAATTWDPNSDGEVDALVVSGQLVYAAGHFTKIGGQTRIAIAALGATDGSATAWNADVLAPANVLSLALSGSTIYAGGDFLKIHGIPRRNIAGISVADGTPTSFDPEANDPTTGGGVFAVAVYGSTVYAAGFFSVIGGQTRNLVAGLNAADGSATSFDPNGAPGFGAFALAVASDGTLYAGGSFDTFDLAYQQGFAAFSNPSPMLTSVVSRMTHGSITTPPFFDINLPLPPTTMPRGVECRSSALLGAGNYTLVFTFVNNLVSVASATVTSHDPTTGTGMVSGAVVVGPNVSLGLAANQCEVNLTNVSNAQYITVTLNSALDVTGASGNVLSPQMGVLIGDVNGDGFVLSGDYTTVRKNSGNNVDQNTFRYDTNADGFILSGDYTTVRKLSGTQLPSPP